MMTLQLKHSSAVVDTGENDTTQNKTQRALTVPIPESATVLAACASYRFNFFALTYSSQAGVESAIYQAGNGVLSKIHEFKQAELDLSEESNAVFFIPQFNRVAIVNSSGTHVFAKSDPRSDFRIPRKQGVLLSIGEESGLMEFEADEKNQYSYFDLTSGQLIFRNNRSVLTGLVASDADLSWSG
jgi:hypothetical protein